MPLPTAILLGASGSVGQALLAELQRSRQFGRVLVVSRRPLGLPGLATAGVEEHLLPQMTPGTLTQAVVDALAAHPGPAVGFSALGVGAGTARLSLDAHRAVDVQLNAAFARGLQRSGQVRQLAFLSAVGANPQARSTGSGAAGMPRYARVKGEAEVAVCSQGLAVVSLFRPSVIIGSAHTPAWLGVVFSLLSPLLPARLRPIRSAEIAQAMVAATRHTPPASAVYGHTEMKALIAG